MDNIRKLFHHVPEVGLQSFLIFGLILFDQAFIELQSNATSLDKFPDERRGKKDGQIEGCPQVWSRKTQTWGWGWGCVIKGMLGNPYPCRLQKNPAFGKALLSPVVVLCSGRLAGKEIGGLIQFIIPPFQGS